MGEGKIRCCGSSLFLKSKFGTGYKINMVKDRDSNYRDIMKFVGEYINNPNLLEHSDVSVVVEIPREENDKLSLLFKELDKNKDKLKITNYGFGSSNLEDVFLKVAEVNDHHMKYAVDEDETGLVKFTYNENKNRESSVFVQHFFALLEKRMR